MDNPIVFGLVFTLVGLLIGAALLMITIVGSNIGGRKAFKDELDERGIFGRRRP